MTKSNALLVLPSRTPPRLRMYSRSDPGELEISFKAPDVASSARWEDESGTSWVKEIDAMVACDTVVKDKMDEL